MKAKSVNNFTQGGDPYKKLNIGKRRLGVKFINFEIQDMPNIKYGEALNKISDEIHNIEHSFKTEYLGYTISDLSIAEAEDYQDVRRSLNVIKNKLSDIHMLLANMNVPPQK